MCQPGMSTVSTTSTSFSTKNLYKKRIIIEKPNHSSSYQHCFSGGFCPKSSRIGRIDIPSKID